MTLQASDLLGLLMREGANDYNLPDGARVLTIRSPRCSVNIFWAATEEKIKEILTANPHLNDLVYGIIQTNKTWALAIVSTEGLAGDEELGKMVTSIAAMVFEDIPELAEIRDGIEANLKEELAEAQAEKAAATIHQAIHGGARPQGRWGG